MRPTLTTHNIGAAKGLEPLWQLVLDALSGTRLLQSLQNSRSLFYTDSDIFTDFTKNSLSLFNNPFGKLGAVNRIRTCLAASFYNRVITLCRCMPLG